MKRLTRLVMVAAVIGGACVGLAAQAGKPEATSLSGKPLYPPSPIPNQAKLEKDLQEAQSAANPTSADAMIWIGRRLGYLWRYQDAIAQFTKGIERYPNDPRVYRHRGHRYITVRQFDKAVADFDKAARSSRASPTKSSRMARPIRLAFRAARCSSTSGITSASPITCRGTTRRRTTRTSSA